MVKASDFIKYICNEVKFNFFSGVPCKELTKLYKHLNKNDLEFITAVNYNAAFGMCVGSAMAGTKSAVLVAPTKFKYIFNDIFCIDYEAPILFITTVDDSNKEHFEGLLTMNKLDFINISDNYKDQLVSYFTKTPFNRHLVLIINEEELL